jgi:hypothetical protein
MVRIRETLDPRPERTRQFAEPYQRLITVLVRRGWLATDPTLTGCRIPLC